MLFALGFLLNLFTYLCVLGEPFDYMTYHSPLKPTARRQLMIALNEYRRKINKTRSMNKLVWDYHLAKSAEHFFDKCTPKWRYDTSYPYYYVFKGNMTRKYIENNNIRHPWVDFFRSDEIKVPLKAWSDAQRIGCYFEYCGKKKGNFIDWIIVCIMHPVELKSRKHIYEVNLGPEVNSCKECDVCENGLCIGHVASGHNNFAAYSTLSLLTLIEAAKIIINQMNEMKSLHILLIKSNL